jgi:hypothetical protein
MRRCSIAIALALLPVAAGCGGSDSSKPASSTTTTTPTVATNTPVPQRAKQLESCIRQAIGVKLRRNVGSKKGRVPHVEVPARYLGGAVTRQGAVLDIWLAATPSDAQNASNLLNAALTKKAGAPAQGAAPIGLVVGALANNGHTLQLVQARALNACSSKASQ